MKQVEWHEGRQHELVIVIGELSAKSWSFYERSTWEVRWYPRVADEALLSKAESLLAAMTPSAGESFR